MEDHVRRGTAATEQPMGEWARSEARDLADAARQGVHEAKHEVKNYVAGAKEYIRDAVQQTREYADGAREHVEGAVHQARDKMTEYREGGFEKMKHDVTDYTREQPMTALLIAAGAGLMLGWLSAVGRR